MKITEMLRNGSTPFPSIEIVPPPTGISKDELLSGSDKKERRYIKDIMMSYGIFDRENNGIISAMFSSINSCNISNPSIA